MTDAEFRGMDEDPTRGDKNEVQRALHDFKELMEYIKDPPVAKEPEEPKKKSLLYDFKREFRKVLMRKIYDEQNKEKEEEVLSSDTEPVKISIFDTYLFHMIVKTTRVDINMRKVH